jgi:hypothetical protein
VKYRLEGTRVTADADAEMVVPHSPDVTCKTTSLRATAQSLAVSVLDLVATRAGEAPGSAIARSVELARQVEQLGYKRYWVAEHHAIQGLACSATPVLIGHIAAATKTIRVGSGGVMLPNHAPLLVAEQFGTLEAIYPGRSIWGWDELRVAIFKQCARYDTVWRKTAMTFRRLSKSCGHTWGLKDQVKL